MLGRHRFLQSEGKDTMHKQATGFKMLTGAANDMDLPPVFIIPEPLHAVQ